jgi:electron transfer flavoprotein beta subunit
VVEPRYPTFKGIMDAKKKPVEVHTLADLGIEPAIDQKVASIADAPSRQAGQTIEDDGEAHLRIVEILESMKVI